MKFKLFIITALSLFFLVGCTENVEDSKCAQQSYTICENLPDGTKVQSCDSCNTCTCNDGYAFCTEMGCLN